MNRNGKREAGSGGSGTYRRGAESAEVGGSAEASPTIIDWIQKLLALSSSSNEYEAALALQHASDLLLKYNLSRADVEGRSTNGDKMGETRVDMAGKWKRWHSILIVYISDHCFCRPIKTVRGFLLVGEADNREAAKTMFRWVLEQLRHISLEATLANAGRGKRAARWRFNFCMGACARIAERLDDARVRQTAADAQVPGLILAHEQSIERYVKKHIPVTTVKRKHPKIRVSTALMLGRMAGDDVSLKPRGILEGTCH